MLKKLRTILKRGIRQDTEIKDLRDFNQKFSLIINNTPVHLTKRKLKERAEFLQEELNELREASAKQDLEGIADALVDLVYVAKGTAVMLGLPWDELWADVHGANMRKVRGISHRNHAVDCIKPPGWRGPVGHQILVDAGYDRQAFLEPFSLNKINEGLCHDDD